MAVVGAESPVARSVLISSPVAWGRTVKCASALGPQCSAVGAANGGIMRAELWRAGHLARRWATACWGGWSHSIWRGYAEQAEAVDQNLSRRIVEAEAGAMKISDRVAGPWRHSARVVPLVVSLREFLEVAGDAMWGAVLASLRNHPGKVGECGEEYRICWGVERRRVESVGEVDSGVSCGARHAGSSSVRVLDVVDGVFVGGLGQQVEIDVDLGIDR